MSEATSPMSDVPGVATHNGSAEIFPADARLEVIFEGTFVGEGIAAAHDGIIYFSDVTPTFRVDNAAGNVWRHDPRSGETTLFQSPSGMANGRKFDHRGRMVYCEGSDYGGRRMTRMDMETGKAEVLAGLYDNKPLNSPNDCALDQRGRVYFTDPRYLGHEPMDQAAQAVYRIDPDRSVHRIIVDTEKPNGIGVTPDGRTLIVADHNDGVLDSRSVPHAEASRGRNALRAYDLAEDGSATFRETLADFHPDAGIDGFVLDVEGNIYGALRSQSHRGLVVLSPQGEELAFVPTAQPPTNCCFGRGEDSTTLFLTEVGPHVYKIPTLKAGYHPDEHYVGSE
jgi:gluconolactonase